MTDPALRDGWLCVPYAGDDAAIVYLSVTARGGEPEWVPAFLDYVDGQRVAKIRPPAAPPYPANVQTRVGEVVTDHGRYPVR